MQAYLCTRKWLSRSLDRCCNASVCEWFNNDAVCNKSFLNWTSSDRCLFRFLCSCFVAFFSIVLATLVLLLRTASLYVLLLYRHRCGFRRSVPVDDYLPFQLLIVRLNSALFYKISTRFIFYFFSLVSLCLLLTLHSTIFFLSPCSRYGHNTYIRGMFVCMVVTRKHLHGALCCETFKVVYGKCICVKRFISLSFDVVFSLFIGIFLSHKRALYVRRLHFQIRWYVTFLSWLAIDSVRAVCRCWRS